MQPISSRIWTRVAMYISRDDNHYTTGTSKWYLNHTENGSLQPSPYVNPFIRPAMS